MTQWEYLNRYFHAARWAGTAPDVEVVQLNSFGCGPDPFILDEVAEGHGACPKWRLGLGAEAFADALAMPAGTGLRFGRFYSDIGYLNRVHSHAWDFRDQPLVALAAPEMLGRLLGYLLENASKYAPDGGAIDIYGWRDADCAYVAVTDDGPGIPEEIRGNIFDPFFTTKPAGHGTGLGLASAYGIIQNHQGTIDVVSQVGEGATFHIYLPASEIAIKDEKPLTNDNLHSPETVLLVDDEEFILKVGLQILEELGYAVLTAPSGKEAIKIYTEKKDEIDIVVLDMIMPGMGGGETYDSIKALKLDVKVLLSSGYSIIGEASAILNRGCQGFIQKPFTMKSFSEKLREILDEENTPMYQNSRLH